MARDCQAATGGRHHQGPGAGVGRIRPQPGGWPGVLASACLCCVLGVRLLRLRPAVDGGQCRREALCRRRGAGGPQGPRLDGGRLQLHLSVAEQVGAEEGGPARSGSKQPGDIIVGTPACRP